MKPMVRVPHSEMTDAIAVRDIGTKDLPAGAWVRVTGGGVYRGDLARVVQAEAGGLVTVQVVPRVDYAAMLQRCVRSRVLRSTPACSMAVAVLSTRS
jgi:hypothetical protein